MADNLDPNTIEQLNRAFEELAKTSDGLGGSFSKADMQVHNTGVSAEKVSKHFDKLVKNIDSLNKSVKLREKQEQKKNTDNAKQEETNNKLTKSTKEAADALDDFFKSAVKQSKETEKANEALDDFSQRLKDTNFEELSGITKDALKGFVEKFGEKSGEAIEQLSQIKNPIKRAEELEKALNKLNRTIDVHGNIVELNTDKLREFDKQAAMLTAEMEREQAKRKFLTENIFNAGYRAQMVTKELTRAWNQLSQLASLENLAKQFQELVKVGWNFAKGLAKGETGFSTLNPIIDLVTGALGGLFKAIPFFGEALAAGTKAAGEAAKFVIEQLDAALKRFQEFSKFGALTADGMSGIQRQFQNSGMSLDGMTKMFKSSADYLATWQGTVGKGADRMASLVGQVTKANQRFTGLGDELRRLGMTADDIGESMSYYMQTQIRQGKARGRSDEDLIKSAVEYTKQLDALQKLTGKSKEALQEEQMAMYADARFRAALELQEMDGNKKGAEAMKAFVNTIYDPDLKKSFQDLLAGNLGSKKAQELARDLGEGGVQLMQRIREGLSPEEAKKALIPLLQQFRENTRGFAAISEADQSTLGNYAKFSDELEKQLGKNIKAAKQTQTEQTEGQDELTNQTVNAQKQMEALSRKMQALAFKYLPDAAVAVNKFTESLNDVLDYIDEKLGLKQTKVSGAMAAANQQVVAQENILQNIQDQLTEEEKKLEVLKQQKATSDQIAAQQKRINELKEKEAEENKKMQQASVARREQYFREREERKKWQAAANLAKSKGEQLPPPPPGYEVKDGKLVFTGAAPATGGAPGATGGAPGGRAGAPGATGTGPAAPAPGPGAGLPADQRVAGLKLRKGDPERSHKSGAFVDPKALDLAERIQSEIKDFGFFSSINDPYHQDKHPGSKHTKGKALDIIIQPEPTMDRAREIKQALFGMGASVVKDEYYEDRNQYTTGGHFHAEVAHGGGMFTGSKKEFPVILQPKESVWRDDQLRETLADVKKSSIEEYKKQLMTDLGLSKGSTGTTQPDNSIFYSILEVLEDIKDVSTRTSRAVDQQLTLAKA